MKSDWVLKLSILLRVEASLFVLSPEIEDRDEVEVGNWAKHKKTFYSEWKVFSLFCRIFTKNIGPSNKYIFRVDVGDILILLTV
jgi:hypothetical protein